MVLLFRYRKEGFSQCETEKSEDSSENFLITLCNKKYKVTLTLGYFLHFSHEYCLWVRPDPHGNQSEGFAFYSQ
jgi:hypothetical protein